tara:strand:+ start:199 stop:378 length:180 start_codon:yes stop_codon:yes gene_type:complete
MIITNAKYTTDPIDTSRVLAVQATIDGQKMSVPLDPANRHYTEILKQVADGDITIAEAD